MLHCRLGGRRAYHDFQPKCRYADAPVKASAYQLDAVFQAKRQNQLSADRPHCFSVERSDVLNKAILGYRLNVIELDIGFLRQVGLVADRNFCR